ncbi:hypothetical protein [Actinoplanes sp. NPDC051851]|uniref:hypothetical protein n=1 Tax=Actinoplanes sp. NPDC051851 TaxID=3154753 RepID=UPI003432B804
MIMSVAAWIVRHRRPALIGALGLWLAVSLMPKRADGHAGVAGGAVLGLTFMIFMLLSITDREAGRTYALELGDRSLRTPRGGFFPGLGLAGIWVATPLSAVGVWPWVTAVPLLLAGYFGGRLFGSGHAVTLTPEGLVAERSRGTVTVPWTAIGGVRNPRDGAVRLEIAEPELITVTGRVRHRKRLHAERLKDRYLKATIRYFLDHPEEREAIGTRDRVETGALGHLLDGVHSFTGWCALPLFLRSFLDLIEVLAVRGSRATN